VKLAAVVAILLAARVAAAQEAIAEARKHATRGSELAAEGDCAAAVKEFTAAYSVLRDPAILFNRAECERKQGDVKAALADYHHFLEDLPTAPNRQSVEERIAELQRTLDTPPPAPPPAPVPPPAVETVTVTERTLPPEPPPSGLPTWVWVGLGIMVVAGATVGVAYAIGRGHTDVPTSTLGNYRF
jgi:hypothetical protein